MFHYADKSTQDALSKLADEVLDNFFPVETLDKDVNAIRMNFDKMSKSFQSLAPSFVNSLTSLQQMQVGKYRFQYKNKKTGKVETIDSHFFSDDLVQVALKLGQDMNAAASPNV